MFFFIAGIQPKTIDLEDRPRMCPTCGHYTARLKRTNHYLSIFFLPLFPVKKGTPFLACENCDGLDSEPEGTLCGSARAGDRQCPHCGGPVGKNFRFCPYCGNRVP